MSDKYDQPKAVRIDSWGFETGGKARGNRIPLIGVFLIVFGLLLVAGQIFQAAEIGASALFLALGVLILFVGLRDRSTTALVVGAILTALALPGLLVSLGLIHGSGWGTLFLGLILLGIAGVRAREKKGWGWAAFFGCLLTFWGGTQVVTAAFNLNLDQFVGPLLLVLLGVWLISRNRGSGRI